ncbi:MAG: ParB/RepB/Spo0J family partition protein [Thermodesulfobium sp.]
MAAPRDNDQSYHRASVNTVIDVVEHYRVSIDKLIPFKNQARRNIREEEIYGLSRSIQEHGIRQPLTVIPSKDDPNKYEVISGERRLKAAKLAGLEKIPCIIISDYDLAEEIALVENIQRQDLHPIELGDALSKLLLSREGMTQLELAEKLGMSNKVISEVIKYADMPEEVKKELIKKNITKRDVLRKLLKSENPLQILKNKTEKEKRKSILRISLIGEEFHIQDQGLISLSIDKKASLKKKLQSIIDLI